MHVFSLVYSLFLLLHILHELKAACGKQMYL